LSTDKKISTKVNSIDKKPTYMQDYKFIFNIDVVTSLINICKYCYKRFLSFKTCIEPLKKL